MRKVGVYCMNPDQLPGFRQPTDLRLYFLFCLTHLNDLLQIVRMGFEETSQLARLEDLLQIIVDRWIEYRDLSPVLSVDIIGIIRFPGVDRFFVVGDDPDQRSAQAGKRVFKLIDGDVRLDHLQHLSKRLFQMIVLHPRFHRGQRVQSVHEIPVYPVHPALKLLLPDVFGCLQLVHQKVKKALRRTGVPVPPRRVLNDARIVILVVYDPPIVFAFPNTLIVLIRHLEAAHQRVEDQGLLLGRDVLCVDPPNLHHTGVEQPGKFHRMFPRLVENGDPGIEQQDLARISLDEFDQRAQFVFLGVFQSEIALSQAVVQQNDLLAVVGRDGPLDAGQITIGRVPHPIPNGREIQHQHF